MIKFTIITILNFVTLKASGNHEHSFYKAMENLLHILVVHKLCDQIHDKECIKLGFYCRNLHRGVIS